MYWAKLYGKLPGPTLMVYCAQGLYVAGRGRIREDSPIPGQYTIESSAVQALGRWADAQDMMEV